MYDKASDGEHRDADFYELQTLRHDCLVVTVGHLAAERR